jgi:hypothetical protein
MIASYDRVHWDVRDNDHGLTVQVNTMVKGFFFFFFSFNFNFFMFGLDVHPSV